MYMGAENATIRIILAVLLSFAASHNLLGSVGLRKPAFQGNASNRQQKKYSSIVFEEKTKEQTEIVMEKRRKE